jgi:DNA-binding IclR family transcriptional regulator
MDVNTYMEEIEEIHRLGYKFDMEEYLKGIGAIAMLIRRDKNQSAPSGLSTFQSFAL